MDARLRWADVHNNLASMHGNSGWHYIRCSADKPSKPAALPRCISHMTRSTNSASYKWLLVSGAPIYFFRLLSYVAFKLRDSFVFSAVQILWKCFIKLSTIKLYIGSKWPSTLIEVPVFVSNLALQHLQNSLPSLCKSSSCKSLEYRSFVSACARRIASL